MNEKTTVEVGGVKFTGGKLFLVLTVLSTLGGAAWGGFEFYNDYRNMKTKIESYQAPDLSGIDKNIAVLEKRLEGALVQVDEALQYSKDIKNGLRDDVMRVEKIVDSVEDDVKGVEKDVRELIDLAEQRFENKRDRLQNDYDQKAEDLRSESNRSNTDLRDEINRKLKELENRLNIRLQRALDNPLAN
jgi:secreted protein with Ig-like and vWFA domain